MRSLRILFLGGAVPEDIMEKIANNEKTQPQIAGQKLQWNIIKGVESSFGKPIDIISFIPVSDYPKYPKIFFGYRTWKRYEKSQIKVIPFINIIILKNITRFLSSLIMVSIWLIKHRHYTNSKILIYPMYSPYVLATLIATFILGGKAILIIPDLPKYMNLSKRKSLIKTILKPLDTYIINRLVNKMSGLIVLTRYIAKDIIKSKVSFIVMEGIVPVKCGADRQNLGPTKIKTNKIITYAGGLIEEYGVKMLIDAFVLIKDEDYRLWLFGKGELEELIKYASQKDHRIKYWGLVSNIECINKQLQSTVLVNLRSSKSSFTKYSFPSKILEYIVTGRPVITTKLPGIPEKYFKYLFVLHNETPEELAKLLIKVCSMDTNVLSEFGKRAKEFVYNNKNYYIQGKRIYDFLESL